MLSTSMFKPMITRFTNLNKFTHRIEWERVTHRAAIPPTNWNWSHEKTGKVNLKSKEAVSICKTNFVSLSSMPLWSLSYDALGCSYQKTPTKRAISSHIETYPILEQLGLSYFFPVPIELLNSIRFEATKKCFETIVFNCGNKVFVWGRVHWIQAQFRNFLL